MANKKNTVSLDIATLEELLKEANEKYDEAEKVFDETDCHEAMHASEHWRETIEWLSEKIKKQKKLAALREKSKQ
jgi:hypothetical protein